MVSDHIWYGNKFQDYLLRTFNRCYYINTLIFPNQQIKLKDLYFPLTIRSTKDNKGFHIDDFKMELVETYRKILICDSEGMGKSTLTRFMCLSLIEHKSLIPIYIELRKLSQENRILDEIFSQIDPIDKQVSREFILKIIELGDFVFFFDGYDEIPLHSQEFINNELINFVNKSDNNYFIITSRPEDSLTSFGNFQLFNVKPLDFNESCNLLLKFDSVGKTDTSINLIKEIEQSNQNVKEFLKNPFLCSLLFRSYSFSKDIPSKKVTFYNDVYTSLFKAHDLSKDAYKRPKHSNLDEHDFRQVLRELAILTVKKGEVEYDYPTIISYLSISKEKLKNIKFEETKVVEDLLLTVPLFVKEGNRIKWAHKSLQDYFAAEYISYHSQKEDILLKIYDSQNLKYLNIIDLIFELDYKSSRKTILFRVFKDYCEYFGNSYKKFDFIAPNLVNDRKFLTFGIDIWLMKFKVKDMNFRDNSVFEKVHDLIMKKFPAYKNIQLSVTIHV